MIILSNTDETITFNAEARRIDKVNGNHVVARGLNAEGDDIIVTVEFVAPAAFAARFIARVFYVIGETDVDLAQPQKAFDTYEAAVVWARDMIPAYAEMV